VPRAVELLRIPARPALLDDVLAALAALPDSTAAPTFEEQQRLPLLEVRVLLDAPEPGLRSRIEAALEHKAVRLAKIETSSARRADTLETAVMTLDQLDKLQPADIFQQLYRQRYGSDAPPDQASAFAELLV